MGGLGTRDRSRVGVGVASAHMLEPPFQPSVGAQAVEQHGAHQDHACDDLLPVAGDIREAQPVPERRKEEDSERGPAYSTRAAVDTRSAEQDRGNSL